LPISSNLVENNVDVDEEFEELFHCVTAGHFVAKVAQKVVKKQ